MSEKWQKEMIETGVFDELNTFGTDENPTPPDLDFDLVPVEKNCCICL